MPYLKRRVPVLSVGLFALGLACAPLAQAQQTGAAGEVGAPAQRKLAYVDLARFEPALLLAPPPADGSARAASELAELHQIQEKRSPADLARALSDDKDESIFIYASVLGPSFRAEALPATEALGKAIRNDAEIIANAAKDHFGRLRPYAVDKTVVGCPYSSSKPVRTSYPSGHAMNGYAYGVVLAYLIPTRASAILARSRDYAEQRLVCGLHFRSDVDASAILATVYARELLASPAFKAKLDAAILELKTAGFIR